MFIIKLLTVHVYNLFISIIVTEIREGDGTRRLPPIYILYIVATVAYWLTT